MTRNPHLTEQDRSQLVNHIADRIRDLVTIRPGTDALAKARRGEPIVLSEGEAKTAARAALAALDDHPHLEVRHYAPTQDAYDAACEALNHHCGRADAAEQRAAELQAEGADKMAERLLEESRVGPMQIREGTAELEVLPARELAAVWVGVARTMLGSADNYTETFVEYEVGLAGQRERYVLIVQRVGRLTPHQARRQAEERATQAEERARRADQELELLREEISRLRSTVRAEGDTPSD